jgi:sugar phosphate isomerase/epimerase
MTPMTYSVSTWNHLKPHGDSARLETAVRCAVDAGLGVELWLDWTAEPEALARAGWPALRRLVGRASSVSAHSRLIHVFDRATLEEEIDLCAEVGADPLVLHPHSLGFEAGTWDATWGGSLDAEREDLVAAAAERARGRGVRLALENGPMDLLQRVMELSRRISAEDVLGVCVDTGHANMHRDLYAEPAAAFLEEFASSLFQLHVSDNLGEKDDHIVPGTGTIGWDTVLERLARTGYRGHTVLELNASDPERAARESIAFLDRVESRRTARG